MASTRPMIIVVIAAMMLAGCTGGTGQETLNQTSATAVAPNNAQVDTIPIPTGDPEDWPTPTITDEPMEDYPGVDTGTMTLPAGFDPTGGAVSWATGSMLAWADTHLGYDQWWGNLKLWLSPTAQQAYEWTDPANISIGVPAIKSAFIAAVDSSCGLDDGACTAWVSIPTLCPAQCGVWQVVVDRWDANSQWMTERFLQPGDPDQWDNR